MSGAAADAGGALQWLGEAGVAPPSLPEVRGAPASVGEADTAGTACLADRFCSADGGLCEGQWHWDGTFNGLASANGFPLSEFPGMRTPPSAPRALPTSSVGSISLGGAMRELIKSSPHLIPLPHLSQLVHDVMMLGRRLLEENEHTHTNSKGILVMGPQGSGKTVMLRGMDKPGVLDRMVRAHQGQVQKDWQPRCAAELLVVYASLGDHTAEAKDGFPQWLAKCLLRRKSTAGVSSLLQENLKAFLDLKEDGDGNLQVKSDSGIISALQVLSGTLFESGYRLVVVLDEAESLFKQTNFSKSTAGSWMGQMKAVLGHDNHAIGLVLCSSMPRARQLFLRDSYECPRFLPEYGHAEDMAGNWNSTKFKSVSVWPPSWTTCTLAWFMLHSWLMQGRGGALGQLAEALDARFQGCSQSGSAAVAGPTVASTASVPDAAVVWQQCRAMGTPGPASAGSMAAAFKSFLHSVGNETPGLLKKAWEGYVTPQFRLAVPIKEKIVIRCLLQQLVKEDKCALVGQAGSDEARGAQRATVQVLEPTVITGPSQYIMGYQPEYFSVHRIILHSKVALALDRAQMVNPAFLADTAINEVVDRGLLLDLNSTACQSPMLALPSPSLLREFQRLSAGPEGGSQGDWGGGRQPVLQAASTVEVTAGALDCNTSAAGAIPADIMAEIAAMFADLEF